MENAHREPQGVVSEVSEDEKLRDEDSEGFSKKDEDLEKLEEIQTQLIGIYDDIEDFYKKMPLTIDRGKYVDNVILNIEDIVTSLQEISSLEDCKKPDAEMGKELTDKHDLEVKSANKHLWNKLNDA